jgi:hypothetical protein
VAERIVPQRLRSVPSLSYIDSGIADSAAGYFGWVLRLPTHYRSNQAITFIDHYQPLRE